jgi:S-formylglutathione hydrolase
MEKGEYRQAAARHGVIIVCPDTSPRGEGVPDVADDWKLGCGAGFYVDATEAPWSAHYRMYSYVTAELPALIAAEFPMADMARQGIFGHSMGGHGALTLALKNPGHYRSCSAFAPIVHPMAAQWSKGALAAYLGPDEQAWRAHDAVALIEDGHRLPEVLVDQGSADSFLDDGLRPWLLAEACAAAGIPLTLRMQEGYDHSYFFVSSFMAEHISWHAARLRA